MDTPNLVEQLREYAASFHAERYDTAEMASAAADRIEQLEAAVVYWQDLAGDFINGDAAWERYGLSCHRKLLELRAALSHRIEELEAALAERPADLVVTMERDAVEVPLPHQWRKYLPGDTYVTISWTHAGFAYTFKAKNPQYEHRVLSSLVEENEQ